MDGGVTRRDMLATTLKAAAGAVFGWRSRFAACEPDTGWPVAHFNPHLPNGRPVWEQPELWTRAAAKGRIEKAENASLQLGPSDPVVSSNYLYHALKLGPAWALHNEADWFFGAVAETCGFSTDPGQDQGYWARQRGWLDEMFQRTFPRTSQEMGWASLMGSRRPAEFLKQQDPDHPGGAEVRPDTNGAGSPDEAPG